jgi:presenilin-like A22 family membrane protease
MKHTYTITFILVLVFLASQFVGLFLLDKAIDPQASLETGETEFSDLAYQIERPPVEESTSFIYIIIAVIIGTILVLILIRFKKPRVWKIWYLISVIITVSLSLSVLMDEIIALLVGLCVGVWKVYRPNMYIHNLSELFIYSGIALIFVPIMNLFSITMLLILISVYDMYAVWKSKHMIKLAKFQSQTKVFAGLSIPYGKVHGQTKKSSKVPKTPPKTIKVPAENRVAVLGGGDIAFPLLFSGVILKGMGFLPAAIISIITSVALLVLLLRSQKGKFYPAMPFISIGCFVGYGLVLLII